MNTNDLEMYQYERLDRCSSMSTNLAVTEY
jgi:hypothetical protein